VQIGTLLSIAIESGDKHDFKKLIILIEGLREAEEALYRLSIQY
jgi:hypothetical protein